MLSRRSVRIQAMQLLYAVDRDEHLDLELAVKKYRERVDQSFELLLFNLYVIREVTKLAIDDKRKRKAKHLPTDFDKLFTAKLYKNEIIQALVSNEYLNKKSDTYKFKDKLDKDYFKKLYTEFSNTDEYKAFISKEECTHSDYEEILLELFRCLRRNELYNDGLEDHYGNWTDDKSLVIGATKKIIKQLPDVANDFLYSYYPDDETVKEYGEELVKRTIKDKNELQTLIKPLLKNWDQERLAIIDNILLQMAAVEYLHFSSIPTKVTLNEYVDISKVYSTPKSKDFVNGVLDQLLKQLTDEGKIEKKGRGLVE